MTSTARTLTGSIAPFALSFAAAGWVVAGVAHLGGVAAALHHDRLIDAGLPLALATSMFLAGWLVMTAAMMLPASVPALRMIEVRSPASGRWSLVPVAFLAAFLGAWAVFGLVAMVGDTVLHELVASTPWLADRPWLVQVGALGLAGAYQLTPLKRHGLARCRHPGMAASRGASLTEGARSGLAHALDCIISSGALMLLMFAVGVGNLAWMAVLSGVMAYETLGHHGSRVASAVGWLLIGSAVVVLLSAGAIGLVGVH